MGWMTNQDRWTFWDKLVFWLVFIPAKDCQCVECYEQPRKE